MPPGPTPRIYDTRPANNLRRNFRWWHEAIIDDMLIYPKAQLAERAKRLGYSPVYLSTLINSDMFRAVYAERRAHLKEIVDNSIAQKVAEVADLGLTVMKEKLETKRSSIPFQDLAAMNMGLLDRLGYSAKQATHAVQVNVNNVSSTVSAETLAEARARLREVERTRAGQSYLSPPSGPVVDAEILSPEQPNTSKSEDTV